MALLKCQTCGGNLLIQPRTSLAICESCGNKQTVPQFKNDELSLGYEAAEIELRNNNFDTAFGLFSQMAIKAPENAEVYWNKMLCRYGIRYQEDPVSHKKIPTLNRMQTSPVKQDADYQKAIRYADETARGYYAEEAEKIEKIRTRFYDISRTEKPYDVFLCFKDRDEITGGRTQDSIDAQELYDYLTKNGFKVFFSRVTLQDKSGEEFEPYIYSALSSAKVMFVVASEARYVNAPWVKNEWSRYLSLIEKDRSRILIPLYRGDLKVLPMELQIFQGYDRNTPGWYQDAKDRVEIFTGKRVKNVGGQERYDHKEDLVQKIETNFSLGEYKAVQRDADEMIRNYPEDFRGWMSMLRLSTGTFSDTDVYFNAESKENIGRFFRNVQKTADKGTAEKVSEKMKEYLTDVASREAAEDIASVNRFMETTVPNLKNDWEQKVRNAESNLATQKNNLKNGVNKPKVDTSYKTGSVEKSIKEEKKKRRLWMFMLIATLLLAVFMVYEVYIRGESLDISLFRAADVSDSVRTASSLVLCLDVVMLFILWCALWWKIGYRNDSIFHGLFDIFIGLVIFAYGVSFLTESDLLFDLEPYANILVYIPFAVFLVLMLVCVIKVGGPARKIGEMRAKIRDIQKNGAAEEKQKVSEWEENIKQKIADAKNTITNYTARVNSLEKDVIAPVKEYLSREQDIRYYHLCRECALLEIPCPVDERFTALGEKIHNEILKL